MESLIRSTSNYQRIMHRIPSNHPVRRRILADDDPKHQASIDNFANVYLEVAARERIEKMKKWNFDFENEVPLEGTYEWFRNDGDGNWIGIESTKLHIGNDDEAKENDVLLVKKENETTPKCNKDSEANPLIKKRKIENIHTKVNDKDVRRKIHF